MASMNYCVTQIVIRWLMAEKYDYLFCNISWLNLYFLYPLISRSEMAILNGYFGKA